MSLALLQKGTGGALCVYAGPMPDAAKGVPDTATPSGMPPAALAALGPIPCVVGVNARGSETAQQILAYAEAQTERRLWWAALIGFSRGCQKVRELWLAGATPLALVLADGLAGSNPPTSEQRDYATNIVRAARTGTLLVVILHTYVALGPKVTSMSEMAKLATGWTLNPPIVGKTVHRSEAPPGRASGWRGGLVVYSTGSGAADPKAHEEQATVILPIALAAYVRELVESTERPTVTPVAAPSASPTPPSEFVTYQPRREAGSPSAAGSRIAAQRGGVLLIGDSLAQGLWPHLGELARAQGLPFHFKGIQGSTIQDWLSGDVLVDAVQAADPALTLVCLGTNDMARREPGARAGELIKAIRQNGSGVVAWIGPPRLPFDSAAFRAALASQCRFRDVRVFDSQALDLERAADRIHMTPAGYRAWAESIAAWVPFTALAWGAPGSESGLTGAPLPSPRPRAPGEGRTPVDPTASLGERAARFALDEQRDGVREDPPGSNRGRRIDQYRRGMGTPGEPWCAWGFCFCAYAVLLPGEVLPHDYAGAVATLIRTGRFHPKEDAYAPRHGDGAIWSRNGQDPTLGGQGHVGRLLVGPDERGHFETIEANAGDGWAQREHTVDEPSFLGWLEYPMAPAATPPKLRDRFYVAGLGELGLEDYVARVVTGEVGGFLQREALKAQAIAARTFVERALRDDPRLGTPEKPVRNGEDFQVAARTATAFATQAARATQGCVILHRGRLILASYVAGAPWAPGASKGIWSPAYPTERHVTYNAGLSGLSVSPTTLADVRRADNRGCMSQNGARALALRGWKWPRILRFFYGEDIAFTTPEPAEPAGPAGPADSGARRRPESPGLAPRTPARRSDDAVPLIAVATLVYRLLG